MQLVVAEKPSVARDLARVLGVRPAGKGAFESREIVITWCVGHLVELDEPASYDPRWKAWRLEVLPMIPDAFRLRPVTGARDQFEVVRRLLRDRRFTEVVNACDAGREGELIFRYIYDLAGCRLPVRRLWISSMTDEAIRQGFAALRPGPAYDHLADAARSRSEADWLVGMNATRAVTVRHRTGPGGALYSIGRVQTPTLALLVERERAIRSFRPRDYWEVKGTFTTAAAEGLSALWSAGAVTRLGSAAAAGALVARLEAHADAADPAGPVVESVQQRRTREPPPLLFDLTSLQRTANRRYGLSAARTLEVAQALYERHKVLTYPRTDARHLSSDLEAELPKLFRGLRGYEDYAAFVEPLLAAAPKPGRRVFDDKRVQDHHAIVPTGKVVALGALDRDERRIFDLVARRFLGAFYPDAEFALTKAVVRVGAPGGQGDGAAGARGGDGPEKGAGAGAVAFGREPLEAAREDETILEGLPPPPDRFVARGRVRLAAGWQEVAGIGSEAERQGPRNAPREGGAPGSAEGTGAARAPADGTPDLPPLTEGQRLDGRFAAAAKQTKPPPRHTEGTLLSAMETAGRAIEDEELRAAMKDTGLGTPATRAATIETLVKRGFVGRDGKLLEPTPLGMALVEALPVQSLASAELTGAWEARLARIARGEETRAAFMEDIIRYVREVVGALRTAPINATMAAAVVAASAAGSAPPRWGPPAAARRPSGGARADERGGASGRGASGRGADGGAGGRGANGGRAAGGGRDADGAEGAAGDRTSVASRPSAGGRRADSLNPRGQRHADPASVVRDGARDKKGSRAGVKKGARSVRAAAADRRTGFDRAPHEADDGFRAASPARPRDPGAEAGAASALVCPRCQRGALVAGRRGWGCTRWREGCEFVIWFESAGRRLSDSQLRDLVARGKTRKATFRAAGGAEVSGRLVLDLAAGREQGAARFEKA